MINATEYKCGCCGGTFEKAWDDAAAEAEYIAMRPQYDTGAPPDYDPADCVLVCDDCYRKIAKHFGWKLDD